MLCRLISKKNLPVWINCRGEVINDDFGTGYSNLRYISEMNPDYVKIDKDFTAMAMRSEKDHAKKARF